MTSVRLVDIIGQYWALIYERQWAKWELLTIGAATLLVILLGVGWRRLKETDGRIGKVRKITRLPETTDHPCIRLLQREIIKRDHNEARLQREISELTTANKQLQQKVAVGKKALESSKQEITELTAADGQRENDAAEQKRAIGKETDDRNRRTTQPDNIPPSSDEPGGTVVPYAHFVDDWRRERKSKSATTVKVFAVHIFPRSWIRRL